MRRPRAHRAALVLLAATLGALGACSDDEEPEDEAILTEPAGETSGSTESTESTESTGESTPTSGTRPAGPMVLLSPAFEADGEIPVEHACTAQGGSNLSPALSWEGVPDEATSLALVMDDPDAPLPGGFLHWVVVGLDPAAGSLAEGSTEGTQGANGTGATGWVGPCPPAGGPHHYTFVLYAFADEPDWSDPPTRDEVQAADAVATATLVGTFENQG
jgi:Raf kinase inhibitor-like YbhB/YbcL family protein